jgi:hypothetical protein
MNRGTLDKLGATAVVAGGLLLALYAVAVAVLLPISGGNYDLAKVVLDPDWLWISVVGFLGVLLLMPGFLAVYNRLAAGAGAVGLVGILVIEFAYLLQVCKLSWELFLYRAIAAQEASRFLLGDGVLRHDVMVVLFRSVASLVILLGTVLFCYTLFRSREYPKAAAVLVFVGAVTYGVGPAISVYVGIAGIFMFAVGCLLLGQRLARPAANG